MGKLLLGIAVIYLLYTIIRRFTVFVGGVNNQEKFNHAQNQPQKPEGSVTIEKIKDKKSLDDDDFADFEEIK